MELVNLFCFSDNFIKTHCVHVCICYMTLCCKCILHSHDFVCVYSCISIQRTKENASVIPYCFLHLRKCLSLKQAFTIWARLTILQTPQVQLCLPSSFNSYDTVQEGMTTWGFELLFS